MLYQRMCKAKYIFANPDAFCFLQSSLVIGQRTTDIEIKNLRWPFSSTKPHVVRSLLLLFVVTTIGRQLFYRSKDGWTDEREKKPFRKSQKYLTFFRITLINSTIFDENDFRIRYIVYEWSCFYSFEIMSHAVFLKHQLFWWRHRILRWVSFFFFLFLSTVNI